MDDQTLDLDNVDEFVKKEQLRVYIGSSLTSADQFGFRNEILQIAQEVFESNGFSVHNPSSVTAPGSPHTPSEVYTYDYLNVVECDLVFFIRSQPSLGLGMEAQIGSDLLIPWGDAKPTTNYDKITPLVGGLSNPKAGIHFNFDSAQEFRRRLENCLTDVVKGKIRKVKLSLQATKSKIGGLRLGRKLRAQRLLMGLTADELGKRIGLHGNWVLTIEEQDKLFAGVSIGQLHYWMFELGLRFSDDGHGNVLSRIVSTEKFCDQARELAEEFAGFSLRRRLKGELSTDSDLELVHRFDGYLRERNVQIDREDGGCLNPQPLGRPIRIMLSTPMSCLDYQQKCHVAQVKDAIVAKLNDHYDATDLVVEAPEVWKQEGEAPRQKNEAKVYADTLSRLSDCDLGVLVAFPPATGVGICGQIHANLGIPVILVSSSESDVSRMLVGAPCLQITSPVLSQNISDISDSICTAIEKNIDLIQKIAGRKTTRHASFGSMGFEETALALQICSDITKEGIVDSLFEIDFIRKEWIEHFISCPDQIKHMSVIQFLYICDKMGWSLASHEGILQWQICKFSKSPELTTGQQTAAATSLRTMIDAKTVLERDTMFAVPIEELKEAWAGYIDELTLDAADFQNQTLERTPEQWIRVLTGENDF